MKKIFTLLCAAFAVVALSAQTVLLTEVWHESTRSTAVEIAPGVFTEGTPPAWMGGTTERGMVVANGKIYVASRNGGQKIVVLSQADGSVLNTIMLPTEASAGVDAVAGGTFSVNTVAATESGDLIISNLAGNTQAVEEGTTTPVGHFRAYHIGLNTDKTNYETITRVVNWHNVGDIENPGFRIGDGIGFYGDVATGKTGYIAVAPAGTNYILRWNVTNGIFETDPIMYQVADVEGTPVNFNTAPLVCPVSDNLVIVDGKDMFPIAYDLASTDPRALEQVAAFSDAEGAVTPQTSNANGVDYFEFKGRYFMVCVTNYWNAALPGVPINSFEAFEFVGGDWAQAVSLGFIPETGLSATTATTNASFAYPASVEVMEDKVVICVLSANMGLAVYELTIEGATAVGDELAADKFVVNNPASGVVRFSTEMVKVNLYDLSGRLIRSANNANQINVDGLKGLYVISGVKANGQTVKEKVMVK